MGPKYRLLFLAVALLPASLRAAQGTSGVQVAAAEPLGGSRAWVAGHEGVAVDLTESFHLWHENDFLRPRLGLTYFYASKSDQQTLSIVGTGTATYPATATNRLILVSYGADWLHSWNPRIYTVAGAGLVYLQASRSGTIDLTAAGIGKSNLNYSASRTTVYGALGLGYQFAGNLAVEGRYQYTSIGAKTRPANQPTNASASFPGFSAGTFTLGLAYTF